MNAPEAAYEFSRLFPDLYRRFYRRVHHCELLLTSESLAVVQHLADSGPLTVTEAAKHLQRSQAATSEIFNRLVGHGLLERMPDERDRRRVLVWLTEKGQEELSKARQVLSEDLVEQAMQNLSAQQRAQLIDGIQNLLTPSKPQ